jgi:hypothetical protein
MKKEDIKPNIIVRGPIFPEPVQIIIGIPMGDSIKLIGKGLSTGQVHEPILNAEQLDKLEATPEKEPFDGDASRFRLGIEALRIGLAYEYDPYFLIRSWNSVGETTLNPARCNSGQSLMNRVIPQGGSISISPLPQ